MRACALPHVAAHVRAQLHSTGQQLLETRAAAEERERALAQDLEAARLESAARVLEAEAASRAAEEKERALKEEMESVRGALEAERSQRQEEALGSKEREGRLAAEVGALELKFIAKLPCAT